MKNSKEILVKADIMDISDMISKVAAHPHLKDKSVNLRYMGGTKDENEIISADFKVSSDDESKIDEIVKLIRKEF